MSAFDPKQTPDKVLEVARTIRSEVPRIKSLNYPILQVPSFGGAMVSKSTLGSGTVPRAS